MSYIHAVGGSIPPWRTKESTMSAENPTEEELNDLVTIVLPRVVAQAMSNPEGEWYSSEIFDEAMNKSLEG